MRASRADQSSAIKKVFVKNPMVRTGVAMSILLILVSLFGSFFPIPDSYEQDILNRLDPPSASHLLGTDTFGRDVLARLIEGSRNSLTIALTGTIAGMFAGSLLGIIVGFLGGWVDWIATEFMNVLLAFPTDVLGVLVLVAIGGGYINTILAIGMAFLPRFARLARASTLSLREQMYVEAGRSLGAGQWRLMARYILPNISGTIVVTAAVWTATAIRAEAALSFLGLGVQPPQSSWGNMIGQGLLNMLDAPWVIIAPILCITYAVIAVNTVGDGLRDLVDPKTRTT